MCRKFKGPNTRYKQLDFYIKLNLLYIPVILGPNKRGVFVAETIIPQDFNQNTWILFPRRLFVRHIQNKMDA